MAEFLQESKKVRSLLDLVDQLRELFESKVDGITLPAIAVIGNQSSGKSSVLERLSEVQLPRGEGMVTKCALVLRMRYSLDEPYAEISGGAVTKRKIKIEEVAQNIEELTKVLLREGETISFEPIHLTVVGPNVPDLTLIDLPGIVYRDQGSQRSIKDDINQLYMNHIKEESCVILCVQAADVDAATQEAQSWALVVDPKGERTVGVVTKIDRADMRDQSLGNRLLGRGRNAWEFKLGAVAMRNRTPEQLAAGETAEQVTAEETRFFQSHPALQAMSPTDRDDVLGKGALIKKLVAIQTEAVLKAIPSLSKQVSANLQAKQAALADLPPTCSSMFECCTVLHMQVQNFTSIVRDLYEARHACIDTFKIFTKTKAKNKSDQADNVARELRMMPRLQDFADKFDETVQRRGSKIVIFSPVFREIIMEELKESRGTSLPDQPNPVIFTRLVARVVDELKEPAMALAGKVHGYMFSLCSSLTAECFSGFPKLERFMTTTLKDMLEERLKACESHIDEQLSLEGEEFTLNHYYSQQLKKIRTRMYEEAELRKKDGNFVCSVWSDKTAELCTEDKLPPIQAAVGSNFSVGPSPMAVSYSASEPLLRRDADEALPVPTSNTDFAVLDLQMRLFCYRKVVYKRFTDQIAGYIRLHFPRYLRDHGDKILLKAVVGKEILTELMAEPAALRCLREELTLSIERLTKGARELRMVLL